MATVGKRVSVLRDLANMVCLNLKSDPGPSLLRALLWFPVACRVMSPLLSIVPWILCDLPLAPSSASSLAISFYALYNCRAMVCQVFAQCYSLSPTACYLASSGCLPLKHHLLPRSSGFMSPFPKRESTLQGTLVCFTFVALAPSQCSSNKVTSTCPQLKATSAPVTSTAPPLGCF